MVDGVSDVYLSRLLHLTIFGTNKKGLGFYYNVKIHFIQK